MRKSLLMLILLLIAVMFSACSKTPGKTSSKVKIVSGNFAAILSSKANNGLFFYGRSLDGKTFTKKVDTDTIDLVFPNGTWNLYAVSYELVSPPAAGTLPDFTGKTYCGKTTTTFNGTDASIQIDLTNAGCSDPAFSPDTKLVSVDYVLPTVKFFTCKDLSAITGVNTTACDQNATAKFNKGYATSYRLAAFEYSNFGPAGGNKIAQSACVRANFTDLATMTGMLEPADSTLLNSLHIPTTPGNGLGIVVEVFYSFGVGNAGCDGTNGVDIVPLGGSPRTKVFPDASSPVNYNVYVKSDAPEVCSGVRLGTTFAAGFGTKASPYALCTAAQLDNFRQFFLTYKQQSFDLLTDINYGFAKIAPIGDALTPAGGATVTNFYGNAANPPVFDGRNHKISNFMMDCVVPTGTAANNTVGFFRSVQDATIKNLTINNGIIMCDGGNEVGVLAGKFNDSTGSTAIENVKIHGHSEGKNYVAGLVGNATGTSVSVLNTHVAGEYGGETYSGGLFGQYSITGASTISQVSFNGSIHSHSNNGGTTVSTWSGGIAGFLGTGAGPITLSQAVVLADSIEGSTIVGGIAGETLNVNIQDSYIRSALRADGMTSPPSTYAMIGGAVGRASNGTLARVISTETVKTSNRGANDFSSGGLIGGTAGTAPTCSSSFYSGDNDPSNPVICGTQNTPSQMNAFSTYASAGFSITTLAGTWDAATSPSPAFTCTTLENGQYYEATSAATTGYGSVLPGDILFCNGTGLSLVQLLNRDSYLASYAWSKSDEGYDIPRLTFESKIEGSATYLKRACHDHYATQFGSGTATDPKWICTLSQFQAMAADPASVYILKKNIFYDGAPGAFSPIPGGSYTLLGNGYGLYNFSMTLPNTISANTNFGIFAKLFPTSIISNLKVVKATVSYPGTGINTSGLPVINIGALTGINGGTITKVKVEDSEVRLAATLVANDVVRLGGAIGVNNGTISKSEFASKVVIEDGSSPAGSLVHAAGAVAFNAGTITGVRSHASMNRNFNCTAGNGGPFNFSSQELMAPFVAHNEGSITEVSTEGGHMGSMINMAGGTPCTGPSNAGAFSAFVAENVGAGVIADFSVESSMQLGGFYQPPQLFYINSASTPVTRGFATFNTSDANNILPQFHLSKGAWDAFANPNPATALVGPQSTCTPGEAGDYWTVSSAYTGASTIGASINVAVNDIVMCNGAGNVIIPAVAASSVLTPMNRVTYIIRYPMSAPPTLVPGRYYDNDLQFSVGGAGGLRVDTITTPSTLFDDSSWSVATDFMNPGTSKWLLDFRNGLTYTTKVPRPSKTEGGIDDLGAPFN